MSAQARDGLSERNRAIIEQHYKIVAPEIYTIERIGGGSVSCMAAELFWDGELGANGGIHIDQVHI